MRRTEQKILSRAYIDAYGANALGAVGLAIARVDGEGERSVLEEARKEMTAEAIERIADCADPVRRFLRNAFRRTPRCSDCIGAPRCPKAAEL